MKLNYWLVSGLVIYSDIGVTNQQCPLNTILQTTSPFVTKAEIGKAQQMLQMRLVRTFPDNKISPEFKITDVFLMGVHHLGRMTAAQFDAGSEELEEPLITGELPN